MVWELESMPTSEYLDWIRYFDEKAKLQKADDGNLLAMEEDDMIGAMTGG
jgi:hypothetical protein